MKYSEIIDVERHFKSAFDITSDTGEAWKTFISNEKFENNVNQIINCFTSPVLNNRNSIWIQGTYGTGKSHSLAVIKHLLSDDYACISDYLPKINKAQLRSTISNFRQEKRVFPVVLKGIYTITDVADLTYTIQQQVLDYDMQPTTTYHILSGALDRKMPVEWEKLRQKNLMEVPRQILLYMSKAS